MIVKVVLDFFREFYVDPLPIFFDKEKEPENYFSYDHFQVRGFRGLEDVSLDLTKDALILLLGLNESGKTSILKAIEAFDFNNDPQPELLKPFFTSIRNKQDIECSTPCLLTADISFTESLTYTSFRKVLKAAEFDSSIKQEVESFLDSINKRRSIKISRVIPFNNGSPSKTYYKFENEKPLSSEKLERVLAQAIVSRCPFIMYFEDFQDSIPDKIYVEKRSHAYNHTWYEILDGLFYNTDPTYNIKKFKSYYLASNPREDDARSVLKRVNKTLQKTFTQKWEDLSGVQEIEAAEITYNHAKKYFEIKISENDGTTYSVHERSKGAVWYLAFLMKTEFRKKKLREGSGKPVYLIDEPASNLHSTAQQKMVEDFVTLVEDTSLIYTTHSRYLISLSNVKNTYVVKRGDGIVTCTKWGDYIKGKDAKTSYYQPLYDCLNIVPNNFDMPWEKAIITEGPSDALTLELMQIVLKEPLTHAIYPGTSATDLSTLISLNLGWGAEFKVLLDSDKTGRDQKKRYMEKFGLDDSKIVLLPGKNTKIEKMFIDTELSQFSKLAFGKENAKVSKKEFLALMRTLMEKPKKYRHKLSERLEDETKDRFIALFRELKEEFRGHNTN